MASRRRVNQTGDRSLRRSSRSSQGLPGGVPAPSSETLDQMKLGYPASPYVNCATWDDARRWLSSVGVWGEAADHVVRPLLLEFKRNTQATGYDPLLFVLWPHLDRVATRLRALDEDLNSLASSVFWAFLRALDRIDVDRRPTCLGQKILNDVQHEVRRHYVQEHKLAGKRRHLIVDEEEAHDDGDGVGLREPGATDWGLADVDYRHDRDWALAYIEILVQRRRIPRAGALVLIGCALYDRSIQEMADSLGLSYAAAKQGRRRALQYLSTDAKFLSPQRTETPLKWMRKILEKGGPSDD